MVSSGHQERTYTSRLEVEKELLWLLQHAGALEAVAIECAARLAPGFENPRPTRPARRGYELITKTWAIKARDFALFEQLAPVIVAVAVVACDPTSPGSAAGLVASAVATTISLARRLRTHAVHITEVEYAVLTTLVARNAPTTVATIVAVLRRRGELGQVSTHDVAIALKGLAEARNEGGDDLSLVRTRNGTHWFTTGL
jgi:hypothetical protein